MARPLPPTPPPVIPPPVAPPNPDRTTLPVVPTAPSPTLDPASAPVSEAFQLPPHQSKIERIGDHVAALSADLREWTELRIALVQRKVEGVVGIFERIQHFLPALKFYVPAGVLAIIGALFVLVTLAIGLGALIGAYWAGFLIVTLALLIVSGVLFALGRRMQRAIEAEVARAKRERKKADTATKQEIQDAQADHVRRSAA